jgi:hypothetical protein
MIHWRALGFGLLLLLSASEAGAANVVTREFDIRAVRMSYDDLATIIENVRGMLEEANGPPPAEPGPLGPYVSLSVSAGEDTLNIQDWPVLSKVRDLPPTGRSIRLRYRWDGAPVAELAITLNDTKRTVTVAGSDTSQLNAVSSYLREALTSQSTYFGGSSFRFAVGVPIWIAGIVFLFAARFLPSPAALFAWVCGIGAPLALFLVPWESLLPGAAIYSGSASFIDRNINLISFIGVILAIISLAISVIPLIRSSAKGNPQPPQRRRKSG